MPVDQSKQRATLRYGPNPASYMHLGKNFHTLSCVSRAPKVSSLETSEQALEEEFMEGWWKEIDRDVQSCLERFGPMSPRDLARQLRMSEGAVASVLSMLAQEGKLRISRVELTPDDDGRQLSL
jgi:hypothetical protein